MGIRYTGATGARPLETLRLLDGLGKPVILRCPVIPGINDTAEHFAAIRRLRDWHPAIRAVELMPYHRVGSGKWESVGLEYALGHTQPPTAQDVTRWNALCGISQ